MPSHTQHFLPMFMPASIAAHKNNMEYTLSVIPIPNEFETHYRLDCIICNIFVLLRQCACKLLLPHSIKHYRLIFLLFEDIERRNFSIECKINEFRGFQQSSITNQVPHQGVCKLMNPASCVINKPTQGL